jgi:hypothetical protein
LAAEAGSAISTGPQSGAGTNALLGREDPASVLSVNRLLLGGRRSALWRRETVITRYRLAELLDKLDKLTDEHQAREDDAYG